jgi:DNA-binding CsgD family transcriptional regulator
MPNARGHIARAYRKIGVYTRVGAAVWMAEHGFIGQS